MLADWTAEVVGRMHKARITNIRLAEELGVTSAYLSTILNGHKDSPRLQRQIMLTLERLEAETAAQEAEEDAAECPPQ